MPPLQPLISPPSAHKVLVVSIHSDHITQVRILASSWPEAPHIEWARDLGHSAQLAMQIQPDLVLIDSHVNHSRERSLEQQLIRWCPQADLYSFHDRGRERHHSCQAHELHWDELPMLLRAWQHQRLRDRSAPFRSSGNEHAPVGGNAQ